MPKIAARAVQLSWQRARACHIPLEEDMAQALQLLISGFAQACGPDFAVKAMNEAAEARATQRWRLRRESPNFLAQDLALGINPGERNR